MSTVTGRYKALRKIADGGTAEVFLAEQAGAAGFRRLVVLKRIHAQLYADPMFRQVLIEEAHVTMGLHHSNLVEVLDLGEAHGRYFLVLELVDGWTLQQALERAREAKHPLPPELAVYVVAEVVRALGYAHARSKGGVPLHIVHRDVCPNNVLLSETGDVKLADFGIAKARNRTSHSQVGMVAGKPSYMSPEQACGESVDARSDIFSAGTLLYYLLTGELPFRAPTERELLIRVASGEFAPPSKLKPGLPKDLVKVVLEAMRRERGERFQTAPQLLVALEKVQRKSLPPFGRTELERWLRELSKKDGRVPATRESAAASPSSEGPEWIELSSDEHRALPSAAKTTSHRRWRAAGLAVAALTACVLALAGWYVRRPATGDAGAPAALAAPLAAAQATRESPRDVEPARASPQEPLAGEAKDLGAREADPSLSAEATDMTPPPLPGPSDPAVLALQPPSELSAPSESTAVPPEPPPATPAASAAGDSPTTREPEHAHAAGAQPIPSNAPPLAAQPSSAQPTAAQPAPRPATASQTPAAQPPTRAASAARPEPAKAAAPLVIKAEPRAIAREGALPALKVWGRLSPDDSRGDRLGVSLDSDPPGAKVKVDERALGTTPTVLRFKPGIPFALHFEREGYAPRVLWLTLVERPDKPPRVSLAPPPAK